MENIIKEEVSWLRQLLANPHIGILVTNLNRKVIFVNNHLCERIGYTREELIGQQARIFHLSDESYEKFFQLAVKNVHAGKPISMDYEVKHKSGKRLWITISGNLLNGEEEALWTIVDITDRVETQEEIKRLKERMEIALVGYNAGVWEWNITEKSVYASPEWKQMLGYGVDEMSNDITSWQEKVHPDDIDRVLQYVDKALKNRETHLENIHRLKHKDGHWIWILGRATVIYEKSGTIRIVGIHTDITQQKMIEDELSSQKQQLLHLAHHDTLTNLPNRLLFNDRLQQSIEKAKRNKSNLAVLFLDLDHFKEINDSFGHNTGDEVLKVVAKRFLDRVRKEDTLARLGGDEFAIIMEDLKNIQDATVLAKTLVDIFKESIIFNGYSFYLSCSIGISLFPEDDDNAINLLKYADTAMYKAKENGRNGFAFYQEEMTHAAFKKVMIETELRDALKKDELVIYYQPQFDGHRDTLLGMEALVRWEHPKWGLLTPDKFLPVAELCGLIVEIDRYIINKAMNEFAGWYARGYTPGVLALNISVQQLGKKDFVTFIKNSLQINKCKPEWIELELTENGLMRNPEDAIKVLQELSSIGVELAVDDFGTGYSSLAYLKKLPINRLKIDKSFVDELPHDEEDSAITKAVIALSKSLNLKVIAEGVENEAQKEFLLENGCEKIQGYLYSKPIPSKVIETSFLQIK